MLSKTVGVGVLLMMVTVSGCSPVPAPIVDMEEVDPVQHNRDVADCYANMPAFALGNPVTNCMRAKGYRILVSK